MASDLNLRAPLAVKQSVSFRGGTEAQTLKMSVEERVSRSASEAQLTDDSRAKYKRNRNFTVISSEDVIGQGIGTKNWFKF